MVSKPLVISIDGPSGAGKSTVARILAERLGYCHIESGAMYRAVALLALETGTSLDDAAALTKIAANAGMRFLTKCGANRLFVLGRDVTDAIRSPAVTDAASKVSVHAPVRSELVERQRELGRAGGLVMDGRDIGTVVFPHADVKIFLDASIKVRSERRFQDADAATLGSSAEVLEELAARDRRDRERQESPLIPADDAIHIDSSHLTAEHVVEKILEIVEVKGRESKVGSRNQ